MDPVLVNSVLDFSSISQIFQHRIISGDSTLSWDQCYHVHFPFPVTPLVDTYRLNSSSSLIAVFRHSHESGRLPCQYLRFFNSAMDPLYALEINHPCSRLHFSFLPNDIFAIVTDDSFGQLYSGFPPVPTKSWSISTATFLMKAAFSEEGCVCFLSSGELYFIEKFETSRLIHNFTKIEDLKEMIVVPSNKSPTNGLFILMISNEGKLTIVSDLNIYEIEFDSPLIGMALSPEMTKIALIDDFYQVHVSDLSFSNEILTVLPSSLDEYQGIAWIGEVTPIVSFTGGVILANESFVPPETLISMTGNPLVFSESNSALVIGNNQSFRMSVIPKHICDVLSSESPGCKLCEIFDHRLTTPPIERLSRLVSRRAVYLVLQAAKFVTNKQAQLFFLNAACFASAFQKSAFSRDIQAAIQSIKVLNVLREECRISMTPDQLKSINLDLLIAILCAQRKFSVAAHIANLLSFKTSRIGQSFANYVFDTVSDDTAAYQTLISKSFVDILEAARCAQQRGKTGIAIQFIEKSRRFDTSAILCADMREWKKSCAFLTQALDQDVLCRVIQAARSDSNSLPVLRSSRVCLYFGLIYPEVVDDEAMEKLLCEATPEVVEVRRRFNLRRMNPPRPLEQLASGFAKIDSFVNTMVSQTGDTGLRDLTQNQLIMRLIRADNTAGLNVMVSQCGIEKGKVLVMRLRYFAQTGRWQELRNLARQPECKKLKELGMELCFVYGGEQAVRDFAAEIDPKRLNAKPEDYGPTNLTGKRSYYNYFH